MYATEFNVVNKTPEPDSSSLCGRYLFYPPTPGIERLYEGGMRCQGKYKFRAKELPLVSVITTIFNGGLTLEQAICSVLTQTHQNLEYIVVDAASSDRTLEIIKKYEDVLDYIVSEPDEGIYEGMNKGIELARGDYIIILNSDDWYFPHTIQRLLSEAYKQSLDVVSGLAIEVDKYGSEIRKIPILPFDESIRLRMTLRHETMLVARHVYNDIGSYDPNYKIIADLKFSQEVFHSKYVLGQLKEYLMYFRNIGVAHRVSKTLLAERKRLLMENFPFLSKDDVSLLSEPYTKNIKDYTDVIERYEDKSLFIHGLRKFVRLNGGKLPTRSGAGSEG